LGFTSAGERSLETAAANFLKQPGLKIIERGPMRSNGLPAYAAVVDAQMKNGQVARVMVYFVEYRGNVYQFVGYSAPQTFGTFRNILLQTMQGFAELQDPRMLNRQPVRISLQPVSRAAPFRDLIPRNLPAPFTPQEVAILNQVELNAEIAPGRTLKIPVVR
jgi:predicted Zn-dependent protease